jgi:peptide deformylase
MRRLLQLRLYPDALLRTRASPVKDVDGPIRNLMEAMRLFMSEHDALGLAAPQIGIMERVIVADIGDGLLTLANPEIFILRGKESMEEGCLSLPNVRVDVRRPRSIVVRGLDAEGREIEREVQGLMARVILHEIDHLNGVLIIDHGHAHVKDNRET